MHNVSKPWAATVTTGSICMWVHCAPALKRGRWPVPLGLGAEGGASQGQHVTSGHSTLTSVLVFLETELAEPMRCSNVHAGRPPTSPSSWAGLCPPLSLHPPAHTHLQRHKLSPHCPPSSQSSSRGSEPPFLWLWVSVRTVSTAGARRARPHRVRSSRPPAAAPLRLTRASPSPFSASHKAVLSVLATLSLGAIFALVQRRCSPASKVAMALGLLGVYCYRAAVGNVLFPWQQGNRDISK